MNNIKFLPLTELERFSALENFSKTLYEWNHSVKYPRCGSLLARVTGCCLTAFVALADAFIHAGLALGKLVTSLFVMPLRSCFKLPKDLDISSSLVHLIKSVQSLFHIILLPVLSFINPDRAYRIVKNHEVRNIENMRQQEALIRQQVMQGVRKLDVLKEQLSGNQKGQDLNPLKLDERGHLIELIDKAKVDLANCENEIENLKKTIQNLEDKAPEPDLEKTIRDLTDQTKTLEDQIQVFKEKLPKQQLEAAKEQNQVEHQKILDDLNKQIFELETKKAELNQKKSISCDLKNKLQGTKEKLAALENDKLALDQKILEHEKELTKLNESLKKAEPMIKPTVPEIPPKLNESLKKAEPVIKPTVPEIPPKKFVEPKIQLLPGFAGDVPQPKKSDLNPAIVKVVNEDSFLDLLKISVDLKTEIQSIFDQIKAKKVKDAAWSYNDNKGSEIEKLRNGLKGAIEGLKGLKETIKYNEIENKKPVLKKEEVDSIEIFLHSKIAIETIVEQSRIIKNFCEKSPQDKDVKELIQYLIDTDRFAERAIAYPAEEATKFNSWKNGLFKTIDYLELYVTHIKGRIDSGDLDWG